MINIGDFAVYDSVFGVDMTQYGQATKMSGEIELTAYKGIHRGDTGYALIRNMSYDMDMPFPPGEAGQNAQAGAYTMHSTSGRTTLRDIRLAKAMDHMARGVMPARTDTDFMSLGVWEYEDIIAEFGGSRLYSMDKMTLDMSAFHWLIPEIIDFRGENIKYNIAGFADYMKMSMGALGDTADLEEFGEITEVLAKVMPILEKYGLDEPSVDFNMGARWDGETGKSGFNYGFGVDGFTRFGMTGAARLPDYDAAMALVPDDLEGADMDAVMAELGDLYAQTAKLESYVVTVNDEGGFEKGFALAKELASVAPEDSRETAFLRANSPEQFRQMMAGSLLLAAGPVHKAFPPATDYLQSTSNFINEGGELILSVIPPEPVGADDMEAIAMIAQTDPDAVVKTLGISVVHEAPK